MSKEIMEEYSTTFFDCVLEYPEDVQQDGGYWVHQAAHGRD